MYTSELEKAHEISLLVDYGKIVTDKKKNPVLHIFDVDCIEDTCIAVPFVTSDTIIDAEKWLIFKAKHEWYDILIGHLKESLKSDKKTL